MRNARDHGREPPTSELWRTYLQDWNDTEQTLHQRSRECRESPQARPLNGYIIHKISTYQSRRSAVIDAILGEAHTYIDQETRDGIEYGVCTCEAMIPGILNVDWTLQEFWQQPGHIEFPDRGDIEPAWEGVE